MLCVSLSLLQQAQAMLILAMLVLVVDALSGWARQRWVSAWWPAWLVQLVNLGCYGGAAERKTARPPAPATATNCGAASSSPANRSSGA
jgi:hypothetical protein